MGVLACDGVQSDFDLLDAWESGDREAGSALFERHFDSLYVFFHSKVPEVADDLMQSTLLACVEARERFERRASFRTFLFSIARNQLLEHLRRGARRGTPIPVEEQVLADLATTPSAAVGRQQEERLLLAAIRSLPLGLQLLVELYYWERLTAAQLGVVFEAPEGTIRTRLRRARELVAEHVAHAASPDLAQSTMSGFESWADGLRGQMLAQRPQPTE